MYYPNGQAEDVGSFGGRFGIARYYYPNGKLKMIIAHIGIETIWLAKCPAGIFSFETHRAKTFIYNEGKPFPSWEPFK